MQSRPFLAALALTLSACGASTPPDRAPGAESFVSQAPGGVRGATTGGLPTDSPAFPSSAPAPSSGAPTRAKSSSPRCRVRRS